MFALRALSWNHSVDVFSQSVVFILGLAFGSFLNVCIYRMPRGLSVVRPRSACPHCGHLIGWRDNIPILSWILLGGHCRNCSQPIEVRYAVVELITGLLFLLCYRHSGLTLVTFKCAVFGFLLLGLIFTDAETHLLPDKLTLTGLTLGLGISLFVPVHDLASALIPAFFHPGVAPQVSNRLYSLLDALLGASVGASFLYGVGELYLRCRGIQGMGFGDVKLMAMIGSFLGLRLTVLTIFAASMAGSIFGLWTVLAVWIKRTQRRIRRCHEPGTTARKRAWASARVAFQRHQMPFGVFLGSMGLAALFFGHALLRWYWRSL
ncbi:MAG: prepilin peptidase [Acidobacteria bacterium]|nr:prepilin peptidase [Acidobacteriota bacterium]